MKSKTKIKIIMFSLFLAISLLIQACSAANQNGTVELEIRETEILNEVQTEDDIMTESPVEIAISEQTTNTGKPLDKSDSAVPEKVENSSLNISLTDDEISGLIFMREEEKLAKDVYLGLFELWGTPIFQNIANSEQSHTDAVKGLLDKFGIDDPADNSPTGVFANQDLQNLYDDLMAVGTQSLGDALKVGAAIEEIDILDLKEYLEITQNKEIQRVYENLLRGSENHLRAFTSTLTRQAGENYQPQYLDQVDYDVLIESDSPRGGRGKGNRP